MQKGKRYLAQAMIELIGKSVHTPNYNSFSHTRVRNIKLVYLLDIIPSMNHNPDHNAQDLDLQVHLLYVSIPVCGNLEENCLTKLYYC